MDKCKYIAIVMIKLHALFLFLPNAKRIIHFVFLPCFQNLSQLLLAYLFCQEMICHLISISQLFFLLCVFRFFYLGREAVIKMFLYNTQTAGFSNLVNGT